MLKIENLHVTVDGREVLKGLTLEINAGEVHAIMGPNGSGKSTLSYVLAGRDGYDVTEGSITFMGQDIRDMAPEERAALGMFLAFQYPVAIPGVTITKYLRMVMNAHREHRGEPSHLQRVEVAVADAPPERAVVDDVPAAPVEVAGQIAAGRRGAWQRERHDHPGEHAEHDDAHDHADDPRQPAGLRPRRVIEDGARARRAHRSTATRFSTAPAMRPRVTVTTR